MQNLLADVLDILVFLAFAVVPLAILLAVAMAVAAWRKGIKRESRFRPRRTIARERDFRLSVITRGNTNADSEKTQVI